ncbi:MAG: Uma2 family endonuclease [Epsilonproteobacteria bacterium]|nr:MAG: Uma2 family endonuclease [Campylobacterota bacterium]
MSNFELLPRYTYEDYILWGDDWELIEGSAVSMAPAPMRVHQQIAREILIAIEENIDENCDACEILYEVDWKISNDTLLRPDIVFVCNDDGDKYLTKAPKIIVEILSPSTAKKDETLKFNIYEDEKVEYYILVYPDDLRAKVYKLKDDEYSKIGDFTDENLVFEDIECELELDFGRAFRKFRK